MDRDDSLVDGDTETETTPEKGAGKTSTEGKGSKGAAAEKGKASREAPSEDDGASDENDDGSLLSDGEGEDEEKAKTPADFPDDWREKLADGDEKFLKQLKRFASPTNWAKSYKALQSKLSEKAAGKLPDNATEEQKAKWREERGVPKEAKDYTIPTIKGHEWSEADEPILEEFLGALHEADAPQPIVDKALGWYADFVGKQQEAIHTLDVEDKSAREDELRADWGNEYRPNLNLLGRFLKDTEVFPAGFAKLFNDARLPDGHRLLNIPGVAQSLLSVAKERYGDGAMLHGDAKASATSRVDEIKQIRKTDNQRYYKEKLDEELLTLTRQMEGAGEKKRGKAA